MVHSDSDALLLAFLDAQRARVELVIAGLDADQLTAPALPSGWTVLGMVEHLGHAERHWFQEVATGTLDPLPWDDDPNEEAGGGFTSARTPATVLAFYREQVRIAAALLAATPLSTPPVGRHNQGAAELVTDLRYVVLHMIEETARHLGHLDAARELLDGRTGLGQDPL